AVCLRSCFVDLRARTKVSFCVLRGEFERFASRGCCVGIHPIIATQSFLLRRFYSTLLCVALLPVVQDICQIFLWVGRLREWRRCTIHVFDAIIFVCYLADRHRGATVRCVARFVRRVHGAGCARAVAGAVLRS
ncbi:unnamed protein product, partial [Ectocarpus sp. 12 AP-2014]